MLSANNRQTGGRQTSETRLSARAPERKKLSAVNRQTVEIRWAEIAARSEKLKMINNENVAVSASSPLKRSTVIEGDAKRLTPEIKAFMEKQLTDKLTQRAILDNEILLLEEALDYFPF